jgi:hypothetical protein
VFRWADGSEIPNLGDVPSSAFEVARYILRGERLIHQTKLIGTLPYPPRAEGDVFVSDEEAARLGAELTPRRPIDPAVPLYPKSKVSGVK